MLQAIKKHKTTVTTSNTFTKDYSITPRLKQKK